MARHNTELQLDRKLRGLLEERGVGPIEVMKRAPRHPNSSTVHRLLNGEATNPRTLTVLAIVDALGGADTSGDLDYLLDPLQPVRMPLPTELSPDRIQADLEQLTRADQRMALRLFRIAIAF